MLFVLYHKVCSKRLSCYVSKKLLKLVQTPLNVGLRKIDVSSAFLFLLMEMSKNDILLSFFFFAREFDTTMVGINVSKKFLNVIFLFKHYKDFVHIFTVKLRFK